MIKLLFHGVEFHTVLDKMFSFSPRYNDDLVFDSYKQVWWVGGPWQWRLQDNTRDPEYFNSLDQFLNKLDVKNWLNEI